MKLAPQVRHRSFGRTDRESMLILQLLANLLFSYIAGSLNQVQNVYFAYVLVPVVIPVLSTALFLSASRIETKIAGAVLGIMTTVGFITFVLMLAPVWFRVMV